MKKLLTNLSENKYLVIILLIALGLRLVLINQSFWLDEAIGAIVVKKLGFGDIVTQFARADNHPPLYYLFLKFWTNIFGYSEPAMRSLSVVMGVGTVYLTHLIASKLFKNRFAALFGAFLVATSQLHIYYSQEARMYAMAGFFAALAIYSFLGTFEKNNPLSWCIFSFSITALIFTDYVPIFMLPVFWFYGIFKRGQLLWWGRLLLAHTPLLVSGLLFLPIFLAQLKVGGELVKALPAWSVIAGGANSKQLALVWMKFTWGRISFNDKVLYYSLIILGSIPHALSLVKSWTLRARLSVMIYWLLIPLSLSFLFSFLFPAFTYFRFIFLLPAFYILLAGGVVSINSKKLKYVVLVLLIAINLVSWLLYVLNPYQQREKWREAVVFVEGRIKKEEIVLLEYPQPFAPYEWYAKDLSFVYGATDSISADTQKTSQKTKAVLTGVRGVYYFEYLRDLTDPQRAVEAALESASFKKDSVYDLFPGVGQITYYIKAI